MVVVVADTGSKLVLIVKKSFITTTNGLAIRPQTALSKSLNCLVTTVLPTEVCPEPGAMSSEDGSFHPFTVNGVQVLALLDNGTMLDYGNKADIECVHGDQKPYPTPEATIGVHRQAFLLQVGVINNRPVNASWRGICQSCKLNCRKTIESRNVCYGNNKAPG